MSKHKQHKEEAKQEEKHEDHNDGYTEDDVVEVETKTEKHEPKSKSSFIRVSSLFDNEWHFGAIEISENKVVDFFSEKSRSEATEITFPNFPAIEFKKLAFQKKENNFAFMPHYSDGLVSAEDLKEYR